MIVWRQWVSSWCWWNDDICWLPRHEAEHVGTEELLKLIGLITSTHWSSWLNWNTYQQNNQLIVMNHWWWTIFQLTLMIGQYQRLWPVSQRNDNDQILVQTRQESWAELWGVMKVASGGIWLFCFINNNIPKMENYKISSPWLVDN